MKAYISEQKDSLVSYKETGLKPLYTYSRQKAIQDGELVDISTTTEAKEAGFKIPVCLTISVQKLCEVPKGLEGLQDYKGRLWDTCYMAILAFKAALAQDNDCRIVPFYVLYNMPNMEQLVKLWLVFNDYESFTIMKPEDY